MLIVDGLVKQYGSVLALDGCGFGVERGRIVGFLGPNGAGKTTAMRSVFGLVRPDAGAITWNGCAVSQSDRVRFGYMPEERGLYPRMRVANQLEYLARLHGLTSDEARRATDRWIERLALAARADTRVKELSKGNQQRVQLAAALAHDPELAVLDEPFSGLDPPGREEVAAILRGRADDGVAVLFSSHELDFVEGLCDDVAIINRGRIVLAGELDELRRNSLYRRFEVELEGDEEHLDLAGRIEGAVALSEKRGGQALLVPAATDLRMLLTSIPEDVRIKSCVFSAPPLSYLFKQVTGSEPAEDLQGP